MHQALRLAVIGLPLAAFSSSWAQSSHVVITNERPRAMPSRAVHQVEPLREGSLLPSNSGNTTSATGSKDSLSFTQDSETVAPEEPRRLTAPTAQAAPACVRSVPNPPSRVIPGPILDRVVPHRLARPYNKGPYRYEPHIGDIRNVPRDYTLPGYEGQAETLWVIPPRDRHGYFILRRG